MAADTQEPLARVVDVILDRSRRGLILLTGPSHRAVDALYQLARECRDETGAVWWKLTNRPPLLPKRPSLLLVHGFDSLPPEAIPSLVPSLLAAHDRCSDTAGSTILWLPLESREALVSLLTESGADISLSICLSDEVIPVDLDLEARRRYAAQVLLTLAYRPLHPMANERFVRALDDFFVPPTVMTHRGRIDLMEWSLEASSGFLAGPSGGGKSVSMAALALARARTCDDNPVGATLAVLTNALDVMKALGEDDTPGLGAVLSSCGAVTWDEPERIDGWATVGQIQLLVDGVDALDATASSRFRHWLKDVRTAYPRVSMILAGRELASALPGEWETVRLEPFSRDQIASYTERYFTLIAPQHRKRHVSGLLHAVDRTPWLREIASHPFHLLSLCVLVARQGVLPRVRVRILEFLVESMLSRWEMGGASDRSQRALREQIHDELSYLALQKKLDGGTTFDMDDIRRVVERSSGSTGVTVDAETLLQAPLEAGLVTEIAAGRYAFAHTAFFDYLAVEPIVGDIEQGVSRLACHIPDPSWDNLIVLAAGMAVRRYSWTLSQLLEAIWPETAESRATLHDERAHRLALALDVLLEAEQDEAILRSWLALAAEAPGEENASGSQGDLAVLKGAKERVSRRLESMARADTPT